jgi:hypothetical protein
MGCGIMSGAYSERRFVYPVEAIEELYFIATKTVAAPHPLSSAGTRSDRGRLASRAQCSAAFRCVSELPVSLASRASCLPAHGCRRAAGRGTAFLASTGASFLLPACHLSAADFCRAVSLPRPRPWPPQYMRLHGLTPRRHCHRRPCWRTARAHSTVMQLKIPGVFWT